MRGRINKAGRNVVSNCNENSTATSISVFTKNGVTSWEDFIIKDAVAGLPSLLNYLNRRKIEM